MGRLIFTNCNLIDGSNPPRPASTVTVKEDRIVSVGSGPWEGTGDDDRVVDLGGRTLMPGMITCHFHSTYHELGATPAPSGLDKPPAYLALREIGRAHV